MNFIIDFYKELDMLNMIIFWGVIIVVILLLIFSIILVNKNKRLKILLREKEKQKSECNNDDIPISINNNIIKKNIIDTNNTMKKYNNIITESHEQQNSDNYINKTFKSTDNNFIAEEYVMDYNQNKQEQLQTLTERKVATSSNEKIPYQKNVLKEMSLNQTSPIGINSYSKNKEKIIEQAKDLYNSFEYNDMNQNTISQNVLPNKQQENNKINEKSKYLIEVSDKLNRATNQEKIDRTAYEIKQEEEAIISYKELMNKKDSIKIEDEEDAIISIEELVNKTKKEELYNITPKEENGTFLNELKKFRKDL